MTDLPAATEIAHAEAVVRAAPDDMQAWLAWGAALARGRRFDDEHRVLEQALQRSPAHPGLLLASGLNALRRGEPALATAQLMRCAERHPALPLPWLALANVARGQGDLPLAVARHREAVRRDARYGPDLAILAKALAEAGRTDDAAEVEREAMRARPAAIAAWREVAIRLGSAGRLDAALDAARHGMALAPDDARAHALVGEVLRLSGDPVASAEAYAAAARLAPDSADYWNKLGCLQRGNRDLPGAEASLRRALAADPTYTIARENLLTLVLGEGRFADGAALLHEAAVLPGIPEGARADATERLAILAEHAVLAPALAAAVATESDAPLLPLLATRTPAARAADERLLEFLAALARASSAAETPVPGASLLQRPDWPAIEAHVSLHLADTADAMATTRRQVAASEASAVFAARGTRVPEPVRFARAIRLRRTLPPPDASGDAQEARLRFWHAMLLWDQPLQFPGQVKPFPIVVESNPETPRTSPAHTVGTWRAFLTRVLPDAPPGPCRAALLYIGLVDIHGFRDGNGRLARFLANRELELAGWPPIVFTSATTPSVAAALAGVRYTASLDPLLAVFARAADDTATLLGRLDRVAPDAR